MISRTTHPRYQPDQQDEILSTSQDVALASLELPPSGYLGLPLTGGPVAWDPVHGRACTCHRCDHFRSTA